MFKSTKLLGISVFLLILMQTPPSVRSQMEEINYPTIDGSWDETEFPITQTIITEDGERAITFGFRVNQTHLFIGATYVDETPKLYNPDALIPTQDYFAIGFDKNGDSQFMGSSSSPDDTMFIGMEGNFSTDLFMQGIRIGGGSVVKDVSVGGQEDTFGRFTLIGNTFWFEAIKPLNSSDQKGNDISYKYGQKMRIMLAYWDNLPPLTEITSYTNFIQISLLDPTDSNYYPDLSVEDVRFGAVLGVVLIFFSGYYFFSRKVRV